MASKVDELHLDMCELRLKEEGSPHLITILVHKPLHDRCATDYILAQHIYSAIKKKYACRDGDKTLTFCDLAESLAVLSDLKLLNHFGKHVAEPSTSQAKCIEGGAREASTIPPDQQIHTVDSHNESNGTLLSTPETNDMSSQLSNTDQTHWGHAQVMLLLHLRRQHNDLFSSSCVTQKQSWRRVAEDMCKKGYNFSGEGCAKKFHSMKSRYKIIKDRNQQTGHDRQTWPYMAIMDEMFDKDPAVVPLTPVGSLVPEENSASKDATEPPPSPPPPPPSSSRNQEHPVVKSRKRKTTDTSILEIMTKMEKLQDQRIAIEERRTAAEERRNDLLERLVKALENK